MKKLYTSVFCMLLCSCILTACNDKTPLSKLQKGSSSSDSSFRKLISSSLVSHRLSGFFSDSRRDHCTRLFTDAVEKAIAQNASISNPSIPSSNYTNGQQVALDPSWEYADHSAISSGTATIYLATSNRKGKIIIPKGQDCIQEGDSVVIITTDCGAYKDIRDIMKKISGPVGTR